MGLAPYGQPTYVDTIYEHLVDLKPDGSLWLDMQYFNYCQGLTMTGPRFDALFGGPPRAPDAPLEQRHMDLAASNKKWWLAPLVALLLLLGVLTLLSSTAAGPFIYTLF